MSPHNNDNENVFNKNTITINNDNVIDYDKSKKIEIIADRLVEIFGNEAYRAFYCKVAWKLSEHRIWTNVESANKGNNPPRLFSYLCKRDGV